jgi:Icc-related predicted phosphoesterase
MKIIALPDLHAATDHLESIADDLSAVDLVLLVGDLTNAGRASDAFHVVNAVRRYNASILAVPGNWDGPEVSDYLTQQGINLHGHNVIIDQVAFIGVGASLSSIADTPYEIPESSFKAFLEQAVSDLDPAVPSILVCHEPPFKTLVDRAWGDLHLGSKAIRTFIEQRQPLACFTGHIHEGVGVDTIGSTKIINPGPLWQGGYAYAEIINQQVMVLEIRRKRE